MSDYDPPRAARGSKARLYDDIDDDNYDAEPVRRKEGSSGRRRAPDPRDDILPRASSPPTKAARDPRDIEPSPGGGKPRSRRYDESPPDDLKDPKSSSRKQRAPEKDWVDLGDDFKSSKARGGPDLVDDPPITKVNEGRRRAKDDPDMDEKPRTRSGPPSGGRYDDDSPPRRSQRPRKYDDEYDEPPIRSSRRAGGGRRASPEDDRGYKSEGRGADRRRRPAYDDDYDDPPPRYSARDRGHGTGGAGRSRRYDDDFDDRGPAPPRRANTTRDRDRYADRDRGYRSSDDRPSRRYDDRDRGYGRDRRDRYEDDRDYRRGGGARYRDERDRYDRYDDRDRKGKKKFNVDDVNKYVELGQKHYKTVAPLVSGLAKMYLDKKH